MELLISRDNVVRLRVNQFASIDGATDERARGRKSGACSEKGCDGYETHSGYQLCFALYSGEKSSAGKRDSKRNQSPPASASLGPESPLLSGARACGRRHCSSR